MTRMTSRKHIESQEDERMSRKRKADTDSVLSRNLPYLVELREISEPEDPDRRFRMEIPTGQFSRLNASGQTFFRLQNIDFVERRDQAEIVGQIMIMITPIHFKLREVYDKTLEKLQEVLKTNHTKKLQTAFSSFTSGGGNMYAVKSVSPNRFFFKLVIPPRTSFYTSEPHVLVAMGFQELPTLLSADKVEPLQEGDELLPPGSVRNTYGYYNPSYTDALVLKSVSFPEQSSNLTLRVLASMLPYPYQPPTGEARVEFNALTKYYQMIEQIKAAESKRIMDAEMAQRAAAQKLIDDEAKRVIEAQRVIEAEKALKQKETDESQVKLEDSEEQQPPQNPVPDQEELEESEAETTFTSATEETPEEERGKRHAATEHLVNNADLWAENGCGADPLLKSYFVQQLETRTDWSDEIKKFFLSCMMDGRTEEDDPRLSYSSAEIKEDEESEESEEDLQHIRHLLEGTKKGRMALGCKLCCKLIENNEDTASFENLNEEDWNEVLELLQSIYNGATSGRKWTVNRVRRQTPPEEEKIYSVSKIPQKIGEVFFYFYTKPPPINFYCKQLENESDPNFVLRLQKIIVTELKKSFFSKILGCEVDVSDPKQLLISLINREPERDRKTNTLFSLTSAASNYDTKIKLQSAGTVIQDDIGTPDSVIYQFIRTESEEEQTSEEERQARRIQKNTDSSTSRTATSLSELRHFDLVAEGGFVMKHHTGYSYKGRREISRLALKRAGSNVIRYDPVHAPANETEFTFRVFDEEGRIVTFPRRNMIIMFYIY